jgi:hypothetical protein
MKAIDVKRRLIAVAKLAKSDFEAASGQERKLFFDVLTHVSQHGEGESAALAKATLRAWELEFTRLG